MLFVKTIYPPGQNRQFIDDWTGLSNTLTCDQIEDILSATTGYGSHTTPCYYFRNIIYAHEQEHINDYQLSIDNEKNNFYNSIDSIIVHCSNYVDYNSTKSFWINILENAFIDFKNRALKAFTKFKEQFKDLSGGYEQSVQDRVSVKEKINNQIEAVNNAFGCSIKPVYY